MTNEKASNEEEAYTLGNIKLKSYGKLRNIQARLTLIEMQLDKILKLLENKETLSKDYLDKLYPKQANE
jgi:hypothetical protein